MTLQRRDTFVAVQVTAGTRDLLRILYIQPILHFGHTVIAVTKGNKNPEKYCSILCINSQPSIDPSLCHLLRHHRSQT